MSQVMGHKWMHTCCHEKIMRQGYYWTIMEADCIVHVQKCHLLGSKVLGFYVFRTLICIVGKPWSKQYV